MKYCRFPRGITADARDESADELSLVTSGLYEIGDVVCVCRLSGSLERERLDRIEVLRVLAGGRVCDVYGDTTYHERFNAWNQRRRR